MIPSDQLIQLVTTLGPDNPIRIAAEERLLDLLGAPSERTVTTQGALFLLELSSEEVRAIEAISHEENPQLNIDQWIARAARRGISQWAQRNTTSQDSK